MSARSEAGHYGLSHVPLNSHSEPPGNQDMAEFGDGVFKEVTKVTCCH